MFMFILRRAFSSLMFTVLVHVEGEWRKSGECGMVMFYLTVDYLKI